MLSLRQSYRHPMKTKLTLTWLLAITSCVLAQSDPFAARGLSLSTPTTPRPITSKEVIRYPLKDVPIESEKFQKIFALAAEQEAKKKTLGRRSFRVSQSLAPGQHLGYWGSSTKQVLLLIPNGPLIADDSVISVPSASPTGELKQFTTVLGAVSTVEIHKADTEQQERPFDAIEFREKLMTGVTYQVKIQLPPKTCTHCNGFGKITDTSRNRSKDGKAPCPDCKGSGKQIITQPYEICWEK